MVNLAVQVVVCASRDCVSGCDRESRGKYRKGSQSEEVEKFGRHDVTAGCGEWYFGEVSHKERRGK